jgi:hypothetical protein
MTDKVQTHSEQIVVQAKQLSFRARLKRHPWIAATCIAVGAVAMFLLIDYFTIRFPLEQTAAKMQSALHEAFPNARFVAGVPVDDMLRPYIEVEVFVIGDERKQVAIRDWLAGWKVEQELAGPIMLRFRDPEYPSHDWRGRRLEKRWVNHFQL